jgi:hypothetical protein
LHGFRPGFWRNLRSCDRLAALVSKLDLVTSRLNGVASASSPRRIFGNNGNHVQRVIGAHRRGGATRSGAARPRGRLHRIGPPPPPRLAPPAPRPCMACNSFSRTLRSLALRAVPTGGIRSTPPATGSCSHGPVGRLVGAHCRGCRPAGVPRRRESGGQGDESGIDVSVHPTIQAPLFTTPT